MADHVVKINVGTYNTSVIDIIKKKMRIENRYVWIVGKKWAEGSDCEVEYDMAEIGNELIAK